MSNRIRSRTRKLLTKIKKLSLRIGIRDRMKGVEVRKRLKKEMDDFEKYSMRVTRFMRTL